MTITVSTRDVDGSDRRTYKTLAAAVKRFEEMSGWKIADAIAEQYFHGMHADEKYPTIDDLAKKQCCISAVSNYGCVVSLSVTQES